MNWIAIIIIVFIVIYFILINLTSFSNRLLYCTKCGSMGSMKEINNPNDHIDIKDDLPEILDDFISDKTKGKFYEYECSKCGFRVTLK